MTPISFIVKQKHLKCHQKCLFSRFHLRTLVVGLCFRGMGHSHSGHSNWKGAGIQKEETQLKPEPQPYGDTQVTGPVPLRASPDNLLRKKCYLNVDDGFRGRN